jgi:hypothetical protein
MAGLGPAIHDNALAVGLWFRGDPPQEPVLGAANRPDPSAGH